MKYSNLELLERLASNYVLGTLSGGARRRFERLQSDRPDVRVLVAQWESRLGQLAVSVPGQQPSQLLWAAIAARTQPTAAADYFGWQARLRYAGFGFGGLAVGVLSAGVLFFTLPSVFISPDQLALRAGEKLPQSYVGLLTDAAGNGKVLASALRHGKILSVKVIGSFTPPSAGRLVLWAVPADSAAFAIGTVPAVGSAVSVLPETSEKLLSKVSKLLVTVETDATPSAPSDNVVFKGNCAKLW